MAPAFVQRSVNTPLANGAITYTELIDGPKETVSPEGDSAIRTVEVPWALRVAFLNTMRGFCVPVLSQTTNNSKLSRFLPQQHSFDLAHLYCTGGDLVAAYGNHRATTGGELLFDIARYQLAYKVLPYDLASDPTCWQQLPRPGEELLRFIERKCVFAADNIPVPSGSFKWVTAPHDAIQEGGVPKVFPTRELTYIWHDVPETLVPIVRWTISNSIGRVNSTPFDRGQAVAGLGRNGYPVGTVLFLGADEERDRVQPYLRGLNRRVLLGVAVNPNTPPTTVSAVRLYRFTFKFLYRNNGQTVGAPATYFGWNYLYRGPSFSPQFQKATSDGTATGQPIYQSTDLNRLFSFLGNGLPL